MTTILHLVEIYILGKIIWKAARFFIGGKRGKRGKSITGKIFTLTSRAIHHKLDIAMRKQKEVQGYNANIVPFKRYKKANGRV